MMIDARHSKAHVARELMITDGERDWRVRVVDLQPVHVMVAQIGHVARQRGRLARVGGQIYGACNNLRQLVANTLMVDG